MSFFRSKQRYDRRRSSRRPAFRGEHLERRLALSVSTDRDLEILAQGDNLGHPQRTTCGCAGCAIPPPDALETREMQLPMEAQFPLSDTFRLHSRPTASKRVYLDFDGHVTQNTAWNSSFGIASIVTPAFSLDSNYDSFSNVELTAIQEIWARVAEDFAPFDVDVTTKEPTAADLMNTGGVDSRWGVRVVVGGNGAWLQGAAGVAFLNGFGRTDLAPAFAFADQSWKTNFNFVSVVISHEVGHTLGLNHHGYQGSEYYGGRGNWGPLMGNPGNRLLTQWSSGDYGGATRPQQDDLAIITTRAGNGFGYRPDDHGNTLTTATTYVGPSMAGVIERNADVDLFRFHTSSRISADISPTSVGANLDILAEILDSTGAVIAVSNPQNSLAASFEITVGPGTYFLRVQGTGQGDPATTGYSKYGSLGQYSVSLTVDGNPTIVSVEDRVGTIQGAVPNGGRTNDPQPLVSGIGAPGATVTLSAAGVTLGGGPVASDGTWSIVVSPPLSDGVYQMFVGDSLGGVSEAAFTVTVDTSPPEVPVLVSVSDDEGLIQGPLRSGDRTDDATLRLEGVAEPGSVVTVFDKGIPLGNTPATIVGAWAFVTPSLSAGQHAFTLAARDDVGNESGLSRPPFQVTVDLSRPAVPVILGLIDDVEPSAGSIGSGGTTNDRWPLVVGTGEVGRTIRVTSGGTLLGTTVVEPGGNWSLLPGSPLSDGQYAMVAVAANDIGGVSDGSSPFLFVVDAAAPAVLIARVGSGPVGIGGTAAITFTLSEPVTGFTATALAVTGGTLSGFVGSGANYSAFFTPSVAFTGTATISLAAGTFTDAAGNGNQAASLAIPVDTVAPVLQIVRSGSGPLGLGSSEAITFIVSEPVTSLSTAAVTVSGGTISGLSGSGTNYSTVFTPSPGFVGTGTIFVAAGAFTDAAANPNPDLVSLAIPVDAMPPAIIGFRAFPVQANLGIDDSVVIEAEFSEAVTSASGLVIQLNSGGQAILSISPSGLMARGVYTVRPGEQSVRLDVVSISDPETVRDAVGNALRATLPSPTDSLAARSAIVVDARVRLLDNGGFSTNPLLVRDVRNQYRTIPLRFSTAVWGVSVDTLTLSLNGQAVPLRGAWLRGSGADYVLHLPVSRVSGVGIYELAVVPGAIRAMNNAAAATEAVSLYWGFRRSVGMVPDAPAWVVAERIIQVGRRTAVVINWEPPAGRGGGSVTHYIVHYRGAGTARWLPVRARISGSTTTTTIIGVAANRSYEFRVAAVNTAGMGGFGSSERVNLSALAGLQQPAGVAFTTTGRNTAHDSSGRLVAGGNLVTHGGSTIDYHAFRAAGWEAVVADTTNGVNTIVWRHSSGHLHYWRLSSAWAHQSADGWVVPGSAEYFAAEVTFGVDFNGNGILGG